MPKLNFTDTEIERASLRDQQTFYTDAHPKSGHNRYSGLRLCISKSSKVFYLNKWDAAQNKVRQFKLGTFSRNHFNLASAWEEAQSQARAIETGDVKTLREQAAEKQAARLPTLSEAVAEYTGYMTTLHPKVGVAMKLDTANKYRRATELHLSKWLDTAIDELPTVDIRRHLNALQQKIPYGAMYAHTAVGATIRFQNGERGLSLPIPGLTKVTKTGTANVDRSVEWADRWEEIEAVENPWIRAAWKFRWLTGVRVEAFHTMRWEDVNFDFGTVRIPRDKRHVERVIGVSDVVLDVLRTLPRINDFVFASEKGNGHIYQKLDRLKINVSQHLRHLWHDVLEEIDVSPKTAKWLAGQKVRDIQGHYTRPSIEKQRDAANRISAYIIARTKKSPASVLELDRTSA